MCPNLGLAFFHIEYGLKFGFYFVQDFSILHPSKHSVYQHLGHSLDSYKAHIDFPSEIDWQFD